MTIIFELDADFVLSEQIPLIAGDLRYGLDHFFIKEWTVVEIAVGEIRRGSSDSLLYELAVVLPDEVERIAEIFKELDYPGRFDDPRDSARKWLYLQIKAAYLQRAKFKDPLEVVEEIYADFDYPPSISHLVRYMPVSHPSEVVGELGMVKNWARFIDEEHVALVKAFG
jgi:hypothetical protein